MKARDSERLISTFAELDVQGAIGAVSARELQVWLRYALGMRTPLIGKELSISIKTVESHLAHVKAKTGATNKVELVHAAVAVGLIEIEKSPRQVACRIA